MATSLKNEKYMNDGTLQVVQRIMTLDEIISSSYIVLRYNVTSGSKYSEAGLLRRGYPCRGKASGALRAQQDARMHMAANVFVVARSS